MAGKDHDQNQIREPVFPQPVGTTPPKFVSEDAIAPFLSPGTKDEPPKDDPSTA
jgi:hypothetical protein